MKRDILKVKRKVGLLDKKYYSEYSGRKGYKPSSHHYALTSSEDTKREHRIARAALKTNTRKQVETSNEEIYDWLN